VTYFRNLILYILAALSLTAHARCLEDVSPLYEQGREYFSRQQFLLATQQLSNAALLSCPGNIQNQSRLRWGQSLMELGELSEGSLVVEKLPAGKMAEQAKILEAWYQPTLVPSLSSADRSRFDKWNSRDTKSTEVKIPWLAGTLSAVLPGAGQAYNGNYQSAAFSFVLNALFLATTIDLHNKHLDATAVASGMIFSVIYLGNITSSVQSSRRLNEQAREPSDQKLKGELFPELTF